MIHHAWHPDRPALCPVRTASVRLDVEKITCADCLALVPAPGHQEHGVANDAGVLRRAANITHTTGASS